MGKAQGQNFQNFDRLLLLKRKRGKSSFASTWNLRDVCGVCEKKRAETAIWVLETILQQVISILNVLPLLSENFITRIFF